jgi:hypothetical protein
MSTFGGASQIGRPTTQQPHSDRQQDEEAEPLSLGNPKVLSVSLVPREDCMPEREARRCTDELLRLWKIEDELASEVALNTLLVYLAMNAPSKRGVYSAKLEVQGRELDTAVIVSCLQGKVRRYHRAYATRVVKILKANPELANEVATKNGYPLSLAPYGFDTSDYAENIPLSVREQLSKHKSKKLTSIPVYDESRHAPPEKPQALGVGRIVERPSSTENSSYQY